jgi:hypothetical protein
VTVEEILVTDALERALLQLVRHGGEKASWHWLATRLPSYDVPLVPDMMVALNDMKARGLVTRTVVGGGMDRWALTSAGDARLDGKPVAPGPLDGPALQRFIAAIHGGHVSTLEAVRPWFARGLELSAILRQVLAATANGQRVAEVALFLPEIERGAFASALLDDVRPTVREALFRAWTPVRTDVPGKPLPTVPDAALDELLRRGLTDDASGVREAAAALAFLAVRGAALVGELVAALDAPERGVRWWALLALGGASDPMTLELLAGYAAGANLAEAAAAIRALGQRSDGHPRWLAGLADPRADVRNAAIFALATVVDALDASTLARIASDPREPVQAALAAYRTRTVG